MGNFEVRLERERDRRDAELWQAHERGEHAEPVKDCNRCWAAAKEAAGRAKGEPDALHREVARGVGRDGDIEVEAVRWDDGSYTVTEVRGLPALDEPDPDWFEDEEGFVREPLSYENREGDREGQPEFNGAFNRW